MQDILDRYNSLLQEIDQWFAGCVQRHEERITCTRGCSSCCRGLFDITLLDALHLRSGFDLLAAEIQHSIRMKAKAQLEPLAARWPGFTTPWILNAIPETEWDEMMPEEDETPCPLLSESGTCLVYAHRPMTCRLNGIPLIDVSGEELFDDWCTLNLVDINPLSLQNLRFPFKELFAQELLLFHELTRRLLGKPISELDTIIPAAVFIDAEMVKFAVGKNSVDG